MSTDRNSPVPGFGPQSASNRLIDRDPTVQLADVAGKTVISVLATTFVTSIGITLAGLAATLAGGLLVLVAALVGLVPLLRHLLRAQRSPQLTLSGIRPDLAPVIANAACAVERVEATAAAAADGPIAEHLAHLATTAETYLFSLHGTVVELSRSDQPNPGLRQETSRISDRLAELAEAAERLARAQRRQLAEDSPLDELIARTERLTEALEHGTDHRS